MFHLERAGGQCFTNISCLFSFFRVIFLLLFNHLVPNVFCFVTCTLLLYSMSITNVCFHTEHNSDGIYFLGNVTFHAHRGQNQLVSRLKIWDYQPLPCPGNRYQREICLMSVRHLPLLRTTLQMFVNKFRQDFHPLAYDCMEQHIFSKVLLKVTNHSSRLDEETEGYYMSMDFVKHHL